MTRHTSFTRRDFTGLIAAGGLAAVSGTLLSGCSNNSSSNNEGATEPADLVVYGTVATQDSTSTVAEAFAVKNGVYQYVGSTEGVKAYIGDDTLVEDLGSSFVMPAIVDGHAHNYVAARAGAADFNLKDAHSVEEYMAIIKKCASKKGKKDFIYGYGWWDSNFEGTPTAAMLDKYFPDTPVYVLSADCHSCWVNTKMLQKCKVTKDTPDPIGGVVEHDKGGNPNGCFRDTAMNNYVDPHVPPLSVEQYKELFLETQEKLIALGNTAVTEVIIHTELIDLITKAWSELNKEGKLKIKVNTAIICTNKEDYAEQIQHAADLAEEYNGGNYAITDIKFFMDGVIESKTAYVLKPYKGSTDNYGADRWPGEEGTKRLQEAALLANDLGLIAHFHAIGDAAVRKGLDAIEYAQANRKNNDIQNCMTHIVMIDDEDIPRFAELNVMAVLNIGWCEHASKELGQNNIEQKNIGHERMMAEYKYRSILDDGAPVCYATDYPAGPINNPWANLECGVTRKTLGYDSTLRNADEDLTVEQCLKMMTSGGAVKMGLQDRIGIIEAGKEADFVVLDTNLLTADPETLYADIESIIEAHGWEILIDNDTISYTGTKLLSTYISGEEVYESA